MIDFPSNSRWVVSKGRADRLRCPLGAKATGIPAVKHPKVGPFSWTKSWRGRYTCKLDARLERREGAFGRVGQSLYPSRLQLTARNSLKLGSNPAFRVKMRVGVSGPSRIHDTYHISSARLSGRLINQWQVVSTTVADTTERGLPEHCHASTELDSVVSIFH